ncbi:hypothetical protein EP30_08340 [Bifidobacterium sp. UTCIF-39]|uniref:hypothetical protein n=1 Tax=Bifidobacterium sp. UTCIF-39 TaxID=1465359 RepID=UPI001126AADA|nr:hypothetical protein [Bifidobacterium sp. UTCIF-39]TPF96314.1 hypothetical protein EP30_08340 [Bifidobacterium sp. UTCIF-39]
MTFMGSKTGLIGKLAAGALALATIVGMAGFVGPTASAAEPDTYTFDLSKVPAEARSGLSGSLGIVAVNDPKDTPKAVNPTDYNQPYTVETQYVGVKPGKYTITYEAPENSNYRRAANGGFYATSETDKNGIFQPGLNHNYEPISIYASWATPIDNKPLDKSKDVTLPAGAFLTFTGGLPNDTLKAGTLKLVRTDGGDTPNPPAPTKSLNIVGADNKAFDNNATTLKLNDELKLNAKAENLASKDLKWTITSEGADKVIEPVDQGANPTADYQVKAMKAGKATVTVTADGLTATLTVTVPANEQTKPNDTNKPGTNDNGNKPNNGNNNGAVKPNDTNTNKPNTNKPAASTPNTATKDVKSNAKQDTKKSHLATTGVNIAVGVVVMLALFGAGAALVLRKRAQR